MRSAIATALAGAVLFSGACRRTPADASGQPIQDEPGLIAPPALMAGDEPFQTEVVEISTEAEVAAVMAAVSNSESAAGLDIRHSFRTSTPPELQFSCAVCLDSVEEALGERLVDGSKLERAGSARMLWRGHSRRYARQVLDQVFAGNGGGEFASVKRELEQDVRPQAILRELRSGDYQWGAWLAYLRPNEQLVPELLLALDKRPELRPATLLALGKSGDRRALAPLVHHLAGTDYVDSGFAASALGELNLAESESHLIAALGSDSVWLQAKACVALGKIGTRKSLPELQRLANDKRYTGAIAVARVAREAVDAISRRDLP